MVNKAIQKPQAGIFVQFRIIGLLTGYLKVGYAQYKAKKTACLSVLMIAVVFITYLNPQAMLDLWLTKDQQGQIYYHQGQYNKAAATFNHQRWAAYTHYLNGDFKQAVALYGEFKDLDALYAKANANAHSFQYLRAQQQYQHILEQSPPPELTLLVKQNLQQVEHIIANISADMENDESNEPSKNQIFDKDGIQKKGLKKIPAAKKKKPADEVWLEQIQKDPRIFLEKKFQQEYNRDIETELDKESEK